MHGSQMYVDPLGNATGYDDVFTRIEITMHTLKASDWVSTM